MEEEEVVVVVGFEWEGGRMSRLETSAPAEKYRPVPVRMVM